MRLGNSAKRNTTGVVLYGDGHWDENFQALLAWLLDVYYSRSLRGLTGTKSLLSLASVSYLQTSQ